MENDQLEYYIGHNISPVHQNIDDIELHYARRRKLYRQCGMPEIVFRNADILEIGPGNGYNTLAFFHWNCKHVDLVEANPNGIKNMQELFDKQRISKSNYTIYQSKVEDYHTERKYDIIIAEGFLPFLENKEEILDKIKSLVNDAGIIVITCGDKISYYIESMKRMVGAICTRDIPEFEDKVNYLTDIFAPQLKKLKGVSRPSRDWVLDNILNPEMSNGRELSLSWAIQYFAEEFDVLGSSPQMFTDYSWSKDIWYDYKKDYLNQWDQKRLSLLMANMPEMILPIDVTKELTDAFGKLRDMEAEYEKTQDICLISHILDFMSGMENLLLRYVRKDFLDVFYEIKAVLTCARDGGKIDMEKCPHFFSAFGRTQQYISFVKK